MKTANFSRIAIQNSQVPFTITDDDWLISITNILGENLKTDLPFGKILFMDFNDTHKVGEGELSFEQAAEIAEFIKLARTEKRNVYVNCHAGICRSGAVVSLMIDLGWEEHHNPLSPGRIPNHLVYDRVRRHFPEVKQSWD